MSEALATEVRSPSRSFAVASGKGGTGKSLVTATLAALLAECGFKVLLVDTDVFTSGLSYFILGSNPRQARVGMQDVFIKGAPASELKPITTDHPGIALIPSISRTRIDASELRITPSLRFESLVEEMHALRRRWEMEFDYIIFDTRGGTDQTSVAACLAAGAYMIITEADKTSWDLGDNLVRSIEDASTADARSDAYALGFVLNKNVLPAEAIEAFLKRKWSMPHLATVPMDEAAIRAFQNDEIPARTQPRSRFVAALTFVIQRSLHDDSWPPHAREILEDLVARADHTLATYGTPGTVSQADRRLFLLRLYGFGIVSTIAAWVNYIYWSGNNPSLLTVFVSTNVLAFLYLASVAIDRQFANTLVRLVLRLSSRRSRATSDERERAG